MVRGVSTAGAGAPLQGCRCGWGKHAGCGWWWMVGTLLGPEGTTVRLSFSAVGGLLGSFGLPGMTWGIPAGPCVGVGAGVWWWVVGWLWVENCTVDASILFSVVCCCG
jgi:hypothetical protein